MRIEGVRVDGFGVLAAFEIRDLGPGLTVVVGPNEAGKSTLLDFIRGVLFGFPDKRSRLPSHPPVRGGRHGGALRLIDQNGQRFVLERHLDDKQLRLSRADGTLVDAGELIGLIGNGDEALFRSVYAFGLTELSSLESLDRDNVQDVVFSAGVLGAGRSATRAARALEQRRLAIVRQRQGEAIANRLRRELEELEGALKQARSQTLQFPSAQERIDELESSLEVARDEANDKRARVTELELLDRSWPAWLRRHEAAHALSMLPARSEAERRIVANRLAIERLVGERSGHDERERRVAELESQLAGIDRRLRANEDLIGPRSRIDQARDVTDDDESEARALDLRVESCRASLESAIRDAERARHEFDDVHKEFERAGAAGSPPERAEIDQAQRSIERLRRLIADREAKEQVLLAHERELAIIEHGRKGFGEIPVTALFVAVLGAVGATVAAARHVTVLAAACVVGAAIVLAALLLGSMRRKAKTHGSDSSLQILRADLQVLSDAIAGLTVELGLEARPQPNDIEQTAIVLRDQLERRSEIDAISRRLDEFRERERLCVVRVDQATTSLDQAVMAIGTFLRDLGIEVDGQLERAAALIAAVHARQSNAAARERVRRDLASHHSAICSFSLEVAAIAREAGLVEDSQPTSVETLGLIEEALARAIESERAQGELRARIAAEDAVLGEQFGHSERSARLLSELETGDVLSWETEHRSTSEQIAACDARIEALVRELADAERLVISLLSSDAIAALELEVDAVGLRLEEALSQWLTYGLARTLLEETLAVYERERQPAVIARASELFSTVTHGRYPKLVAREDPDGTRRHGLEAITASGIRIDSGDLSRGTAEQLYLCLRLAFAMTFAERSTSLPLVLDDVLVNFDPARAQAVAEVIAKTAVHHQVLAFTCHPRIVEHFKCADAAVNVVELASLEVS